ncbi:MAG: enoyl-CoA hydratase/isomerase family protein [Desulfocucumaceae bacterium]
MIISTLLENGVLYLLLDNPPANALSVELLKQLDTVVKDAMSDEKVRILVVSGMGDKFFSAGADVNDISEAGTIAEIPEVIKNGQQVFNRIARSDKPVIACINGTSLGGGLELAMACHIRVCSKAARLGLPEINFGLIPSFGGSQRMPRLIGFSRGLEMILTGRIIGAEEAYAVGLVDRITPPDELRQTVKELAESIASRNALTLKNDLRLIREGLQHSLEEGLKLELELMQDVFPKTDIRKYKNDFLQNKKQR